LLRRSVEPAQSDHRQQLPNAIITWIEGVYRLTGDRKPVLGRSTNRIEST
jgi:hypothetical protein